MATRQKKDITLVNLDAPTAAALMSGPGELENGQRGLALDTEEIVWRDRSGKFHRIRSSTNRDVTAQAAIGGIPAGTAFPKGTPIWDILDQMLFGGQPVENPVLTNPSVSLSLSPSTPEYAPGTPLSITLTANFNRGSISPAFGTSGFRSGAATNYAFNIGGTVVNNGTNPVYTYNGTMPPANLNISVAVSYAAGEQPLNSEGDTYDSPLPAGIVSNSAVIMPLAPNEYTLTVNINPSGAGVVDKLPSALAYAAGTQVMLTAGAMPGFDFANWTGDATGTNIPAYVTMDGNKTVTANFTGAPPPGTPAFVGVNNTALSSSAQTVVTELKIPLSTFNITSGTAPVNLDWYEADANPSAIRLQFSDGGIVKGDLAWGQTNAYVIEWFIDNNSLYISGAFTGSWPVVLTLTWNP